MDTTKDEFNIPNIIVDPRTRTQYSKGKFLGKVSEDSLLVDNKRSILFFFFFINLRVVLLDVMN